MEKITNNTLHSRRPSRPSSNSSAADVATSFELIVVTAAIAVAIAATAAIAVPSLSPSTPSMSPSPPLPLPLSLLPSHHCTAAANTTLQALLPRCLLTPQPLRCYHHHRTGATAAAAAALPPPLPS
jgi:hypothetical protein